MPAGQIAGWLAWSSVVLVALIGGYFSRSGSLLNRRTSTEQMFLDLLKIEKAKIAELEKEIESLKEEHQTLRQENIKGLMAQERLAQMQAKLTEIPAIRAYPEILQIVSPGVESDVDRTGEG